MKTIYFSRALYLSWLSNIQSLILTGPLGSIQIFLGPYYSSHSSHSLTLLNPPAYLIARLKQFDQGLTIGHTKRLYQSGVWNQASFTGPKHATFKLGFSHPTSFTIPPHITWKTSRDSGQDRTISFLGIDKEQVSLIANSLYILKRPEVYRGTGFRYANQILRRKVGKKK
jgi:hypothetical protein